MCRTAAQALLVSTLISMSGCMSTEAFDAQVLESFPPPGRLVDVGDKRLHVRCLGEAVGPTVVIETGAAASSVYWWSIQDRIAEFAHVCTYDRAGLGWSDRAPHPAVYRLDDRVDDLRTLLAQAGVEPRYILVGHSLGGLLARRFASSFSNDVAGVVLVDSAEEHYNLGNSIAHAERTRLIRRLDLLVKALNAGVPFVRRMSMLQVQAGSPPQTAIALRASVFEAGKHELEAVNSIPQDMSAPGSFGRLGAMPLIVISRGRYDPEHLDFENEWRAAQLRLSSLSTTSEHIVATHSRHGIHVDEPHVVVAAVERLVAQQRLRSERTIQSP